MNCRKNTLSRKIPWNSPLFTRSENPSQAALSGGGLLPVWKAAERMRPFTVTKTYRNFCHRLYFYRVYSTLLLGIFFAAPMPDFQNLLTQLFPIGIFQSLVQESGVLRVFTRFVYPASSRSLPPAPQVGSGENPHSGRTSTGCPL